MIEPLHDAHTSIRAPALNQQFGGSKVVAHPLDERGRDAALAIIDKNYVRGRLEAGCNGHLKYGELDDQTGYLRIDGFGGYAAPLAKPAFASTLEALDATFDAAMKSFTGKSSLVIDVRINGGGSVVLGVAVASRLTDREYVAFIKRARKDQDQLSVGDQGWTAPQTARVVPSSRPRFLGRVFLLTGPDGYSAAETFTMALLCRTPHVTRVGASTQGVYSDVLGRDLPNGWGSASPTRSSSTPRSTTTRSAACGPTRRSRSSRRRI
jgi:C-terminal processing protease CtpA/Prc